MMTTLRGLAYLVAYIVFAGLIWLASGIVFGWLAPLLFGR